MRVLDFEKPIQDLSEKIDQLKTLSQEGNIDLSKEIFEIEKRAQTLKKEIFTNLSPLQILQIARHPDRPDTSSLIQRICKTYIELHGDRRFSDDPAIVGGLAEIESYRVIILGHQKGHNTKQNIKHNFGMPNPEGYRKALRLMHMAEKFRLPIITLIDTPGAYPGIEAEQNGQAEAIARNLKEMANLTVPIISIVIGEGGSGGALGIGVANKLLMLEYAVYSVISPEGCASILFRDAKKASQAAESLKITAKDIIDLKICDGIITEPLGGAHTNWEETAENIKKAIMALLNQLTKLSPSECKATRYKKFRSLG